MTWEVVHGWRIDRWATSTAEVVRRGWGWRVHMGEDLIVEKIGHCRRGRTGSHSAGESSHITRGPQCCTVRTAILHVAAGAVVIVVAGAVVVVAVHDGARGRGGRRGGCRGRWNRGEGNRSRRVESAGFVSTGQGASWRAEKKQIFSFKIYIWRYYTRCNCKGVTVRWSVTESSLCSSPFVKAFTYLLCERNFPVEWPEPSQPGIGHL